MVWSLGQSDSQRFYFQVVLAEMITKEELLDQLMRLSPTSAEEALAAGKLCRDH